MVEWILSVDSNYFLSLKFAFQVCNRIEIAVCVIVRFEFDSGADSLFTSTNHDDENALDLNII